jgi:pimeloyl-ACP methyl ester carboxylesterase
MYGLGWETAHLVGNSLGGWLALALAERGRAQTVVAFSPAGASRDRRAYARLSRLLRARHAGARYGATDRLLAHRATRGIVLGPVINRHRDLSAGEVAGRLLDIRACRLTDGLLAWMDRSGPLTAFDIPADVPLRIAWPLKDRLTPWREYGRPFHALVQRAERIHLDDVGHVPMYDDPRLVADTILSHTRGLTPKAG